MRPVRSLGGWYCLTPDGDFYVEDIRGGGRVGPSRVSPLAAGGAPPSGLAGQVYRFKDYPGRADFAALLRETATYYGPVFCV